MLSNSSKKQLPDNIAMQGRMREPESTPALLVCDAVQQRAAVDVTDTLSESSAAGFQHSMKHKPLYNRIGRWRGKPPKAKTSRKPKAAT